MHYLEFVIAFALLILIFIVSKYKRYLLAALITNFPVFSFFTYSISDKPQMTAIYLSVFSFIVSLSFLTVYLSGYFIQNKMIGLVIGFSTWFILSISAYLLIKYLFKGAI
ncbi:MAG: hypothetical protein ACYCTB_05765 [bacterium]